MGVAFFLMGAFFSIWAVLFLHVRAIFSVWVGSFFECTNMPPPQQYFCGKIITFFTEQIFIIFPDRGGLNFLRELIFSFLRGGGGEV